jgi:hypothetical protein
MKRLELLLLVILGGFALTFLFLSRDYNPTAALFPRFIAFASLVFLGLTRMVSGAAVTENQNETAGTDMPDTESLPIPILAVEAGYVVLIYLIGFFLATLLYLIVAPIQLRYARRGVAFAASVMLTLMIAGSFMWLFDIQLPPGAIWELF